MAIGNVQETSNSYYKYFVQLFLIHSSVSNKDMYQIVVPIIVLTFILYKHCVHVGGAAVLPCDVGIWMI